MPTVRSRTLNPIEQIGGLVLNLDASDLRTISIATGVDEWLDKSPSQANATQGTGSAQPTLDTTVQNKGGIDFNDAFDQNLGLTINLDQNVTIFGVAEYVAQSGVESALKPFFIPSANDFIPSPLGYGMGPQRLGVNTVFGHFPSLTGTADITKSLAPDNNWHIHTVINNNNAGEYFFDGVSEGTTTLDRTTGFASSYQIGGQGAFTRWFRGNVSELVIYNRALSTAERQDVERYLSDKWGL